MVDASKSFAVISLFALSGCTFIMGSPPAALTSNPAPEEKISPVLVYTSDCDFKKEIDGIGILGARTAYPAAYAGEAVCTALNNELPSAMDAAGIAATIRTRKPDPKTARPSTLKTLRLSAQSMLWPSGNPTDSPDINSTRPALASTFDCTTQRPASIGALPKTHTRYRFANFPIEVLPGQRRTSQQTSRTSWREPCYSGVLKNIRISAKRLGRCALRRQGMRTGRDARLLPVGADDRIAVVCPRV